jgi:hypothetical protein
MLHAPDQVEIAGVVFIDHGGAHPGTVSYKQVDLIAADR